MKQFLLKKRVGLLVCLVIICITSVISITLFDSVTARDAKAARTVDELYAAAVKDSMTIEADEIFPLICIEPGSDLVEWNEANDKVLMATWHKKPEHYPQNETVTLDHGEVWTFTFAEMEQWYANNSKGVSDWDMRFRQLIGLPPSSTYTHFTFMWVDPADILRPAYDSDITASNMGIALDEQESEAYQAWFQENILFSYFDSAYPWTRLGYTYDWADNGTEYGLCEFLVAKDAVITVENTLTTEELVALLKAS